MAKYTLTLITKDIPEADANQLLDLICNIATEIKLNIDSLNFISDEPPIEP